MGVKNERLEGGRRACVGMAVAGLMMATAGAWGRQTPPPPQPTAPEAVTTGPATPSGTPTQPGVAPAPMLPLLTVNFDGGTIEEYINTLRDTTHGMVNVTMPFEAAQKNIPPIHLKNVSVRQALNVLTYIFPMQDGIRINVQEDRADGGWPTFFLIYNEAPTPSLKAITQDKVTEIFALKELTSPPAGLPLEQVLGAIETALKLDGPADMTFHKDSQVLIVRGSARQVATARAIVAKLSGQTDAARQEEAKKADDELAMAQVKREQTQRLITAQAEIARREMLYKQAADELDRQKKLAETGAISVDKLAGARDALEKEGIELRMAQDRIDQIRQDAKQSDELARERVAEWRRGQGQAERDELQAQIRQLQDTVRALQDQIRALQAAGAEPQGR